MVLLRRYCSGGIAAQEAGVLWRRLQACRMLSAPLSFCERLQMSGCMAANVASASRRASRLQIRLAPLVRQWQRGPHGGCRCAQIADGRRNWLSKSAGGPRSGLLRLAPSFLRAPSSSSAMGRSLLLHLQLRLVLLRDSISLFRLMTDVPSHVRTAPMPSQLSCCSLATCPANSHDYRSAISFTCPPINWAADGMHA